MDAADQELETVIGENTAEREDLFTFPAITQLLAGFVDQYGGTQGGWARAKADTILAAFPMAGSC